MDYGRVVSGNAVGGVLSPTNVGVAYFRSVVGEGESVRGFHSISLSADMINEFLGRLRYPGLQLTYNYDFLVGKWESAIGKSWIYTGPGVALGYGGDYAMPMGHIFGLSLQFGYDYLFSDRGIHIGVGVNLILGYHVSLNEKTAGIDMRLYNYGLIRSLIPQCRILYEFGGRSLPGAGSTSGRLEGSGKEAETEDYEGADVGSRSERRHLITFGIEASGILGLYDYHSFNYRSPFGREEDMTASVTARLAAQAYLNCGVNVKDFMNISLMVGYQGAGHSTDEAVLSTELRATYLFEEMRNGDRPMAFAQGGPGWNIMNENSLAGVMKFGGGYRISLSEAIKLDFLLGVQFLYLSPKIYEEGYGGRSQIASENVGKNNEWTGGLTWGAALCF